MKTTTVIAIVGNGDCGKTTSTVEIAKRMAKDYPVTIVGYDPELENSLTEILAEGMPDPLPTTATIVDLLRMPLPHNGGDLGEIRSAILSATIKHKDGFGVITVDQGLVDFETEGGNIYALMRTLAHFPTGIVFIDCASGSGGFSLLSAVAAADYVIGVSKPAKKSVTIARRVCGIDDATINGETMNFIEMLTGQDEETGIEFGPTYLGMIGSMFIGARYGYAGATQIVETGIAHDLRDWMMKIVGSPGYIGFTPCVYGKDKRGVKNAYDFITSQIVKRIIDDRDEKIKASFRS
jgi:cellulose biosynthesis protein BcsQ